MRTTTRILAGILLAAPLAACSGPDEGNIVVATERMISISTSRLNDPIDLAAAHCAKYGKKVVARGGVKLGDPAYKILWGYDCVEPGAN